MFKLGDLSVMKDDILGHLDTCMNTHFYPVTVKPKGKATVCVLYS